MSIVSTLNANPSLKRHLWLVSLTFPLSPLWGIALISLTGNPLFAWAPVCLFYVALPAIDEMVGNDKHDILGLMETQAELSPFYKFMVHALLPVIYGTWLAGAWYVVNVDLPTHAYVALGIAHGWGLAFAINSGHEVGHKTDKLSKWMALFMLAPSFYGHFRVEHNQGHHVDVATPKDHATARFNESYWAFILREYPGAWKRAWAIEAKRARRKGYRVFSLKNEVILSIVMAAILWASVIIILGTSVIPYLLLTWVISVTALSSQNYIAHYGLLREQRPNGKYYPCETHHSWNCNRLVTNLTTYNLARHSDHHANPARHYQHLRTFPNAPQLPHGYQAMFMIAYVPPLFYKIMNPRVLKNVGGDMERVLTKDKTQAATNHAHGIA